MCIENKVRRNDSDIIIQCMRIIKTKLTFCWTDDSWHEEEWRQSNAQDLRNVRLHVQVWRDLKVHRRKTRFFSVVRSAVIMQRLSASWRGAVSSPVLPCHETSSPRKMKMAIERRSLDSISPVQLLRPFYTHEKKSMCRGVFFSPS